MQSSGGAVSPLVNLAAGVQRRKDNPLRGYALFVHTDRNASAIIGNGVKHFEKIGINDIFGQSGKPADLLAEYGLTGQQIADRIAGAF